MQRGKKIAAALIMLGLGFGTALLFRRADSPQAAAPVENASPQKEALVLRESGDHPSRPTQGSQLGPVPLKPSQATKPPRDLSEPIASPRTPTAPPELPLRFDRSLLRREPSRGAERSLARRDQYNPSTSRTIPQPARPPRVHRVVDGDTLGRLAERFLGDASRHAEIHALNQAQLPDPNVLPIGVELKIPPREGTLALKPVSTEDEQSARPNSSAAGYPRSSSQSGAVSDRGLVPVSAGKPHSH